MIIKYINIYFTNTNIFKFFIFNFTIKNSYLLITYHHILFYKFHLLFIKYYFILIIFLIIIQTSLNIIFIFNNI
jgi:hypothetical protein